jgi:hypothetical protein
LFDCLTGVITLHPRNPGWPGISQACLLGPSGLNFRIVSRASVKSLGTLLYKADGEPARQDDIGFVIKPGADDLGGDRIPFAEIGQEIIEPSVGIRRQIQRIDECLRFPCTFMSGGIAIVFVTPKLSKAARLAFNVHERPVNVSYTALPAPGPLRYGTTPLPGGTGPSGVWVIGST